MSVRDPDRAVARDEPAQDAIATEVFAGVAECLELPADCVAAVGVASATRATELVYVVCETKVADGPQREQLARAVRERLRRHGIAVDHVRLVEPGAIPRTTSAKIRRSAVARTLAPTI